MDLLYEDVKIGQDIPSLVKVPTTVNLFMFSAVTWNPHRIHYDANFAREHEGLPGILVHRPLQGCYLAQMLIDWIGNRGTLRKLSWSNRSPAQAGDTLICRGKVTGKYNEDAQDFIECEVWIENDRGEVITPGSALVMLFQDKNKEK